ncbi:MAG: hypothetical protein QOD39_4572, partial [Mycobacterium sp.]|nr:hypothetical protein [Mycobacterium sp.]
ALILARFSATSSCEASAGYGCQVRVLIDGVEAQPAGINASVFDSSTEGTNADGREAHMIERSRGPLGAGDHVVKVQMAVPNGIVSFTLTNWNLTVERIRA